MHAAVFMLKCNKRSQLFRRAHWIISLKLLHTFKNSTFVLETAMRLLYSNGACRKTVPTGTRYIGTIGVLFRIHDAACNRVLSARWILVSSSGHRSQLHLSVRRRVCLTSTATVRLRCRRNTCRKMELKFRNLNSRLRPFFVFEVTESVVFIRFQLITTTNWSDSKRLFLNIKWFPSFRAMTLTLLVVRRKWITGLWKLVPVCNWG